jgi:3',5'-cyclic AMP phosphodiesterase CpdA
MPILINRRKFLYAAGAAGLLAKTLHAKPERQRWALLSDTHISEDLDFTNRGFLPARNLKSVVGQVVESHWDQQLINGDLALRFGLAADYRRFMDLTQPLASAAPLALSLGNHDDRMNAIAALGAKSAVANKWVSIFDAGPFHVVVLDSLFQTNMSAGFLGKLQRDWLTKVLDERVDKPTLVFVHHTLDDSDGSLLDSDRFLKIVTARKQVKAVFYGHSHMYRYDVQDGLHLVNQPAVGYNFADDQPIGWLEAELGPMDAQLTLHAIGGNRALDGQTKLIRWR